MIAISFEDLENIYIFFQSFKGVAQKLSPLHPFQFQARESHGRPNFHARPLKLSKNLYLAESVNGKNFIVIAPSKKSLCQKTDFIAL